MTWQSFLVSASPVLSAVLQVILVVGTPIAVTAGVRYFKAHTTAAQYAALRQVVGDTVQAAEQYLSSSDGKAKRAWVLSLVQAWLTANHVTIDAALVEATLQSAVFALPPTHGESAPTAPKPAAA